MLTQHLEKLVHFVGAARHSSIRQYALRNGLSQPAISKNIQALEAALETSLLVRRREGVELTQQGEVLCRWAETILSQAEEMDMQLRRAGNVALSGEFTMGVYQSIAVYFVPEFYKFIRREHPGLNLQFVNAPSQDLVRLLKAGDVDFIISINPPKRAEFYSLALFEDVYSLYQSCSSSLDAARAPIFSLLSAKDDEGRTVESYVKAARPKAKLVACGDFESVKSMLEADAGLAVLPDRVALPLLNTRKIIRVENATRLNHFGRHSIAFSCRSHRSSDASMRWIADQLRLMLRSEK